MPKKAKPTTFLQKIKAFAGNKWFAPSMLGLCFLFLLTARLQINLPTFGDEPHYLVMSSSLVKDGDLNLKNNYQNRDYEPYFTTNLAPQGNPPQDSNDWRSIHGSGIPVFLLPGYVIAGHWGAAIQMVLLSVFTVWLAWVWTKQITGRKKLAYLSAGLLTISYFFANLAGYIYPDVFVAAAALGSLIIIQKYYKNPWFQLLLGAFLGFLILVHFRTLILVAPVFAILLYQTWRTGTTWSQKIPWRAFAAFAVFAAYYIYETYFQGASIAPSIGSSGASLRGDVFMNISAMLFDSNKGLLAFNPILLLLVIGLPIWFKEHRESLIMTTLILLPTIATTVMFIEWHGGYAPTGRYMMSFVPALIPALAFALSKFTMVWQKVVTWVLGIATLVITFDAMRSHFPLIDPNTWSRHRLFEHIEYATGFAADKLLPHFITTLPQHGDITGMVGAQSPIKLIVWWLVIVGLLTYGYMLSKNRPLAARKKAS